MDLDKVVNKVKAKLATKLDPSRSDKAGQGVTISEKEAKRISSELMGFHVPARGSSGEIKHKDQVVGRASDFGGILLTDKTFIKKYVKDIIWYVS